MGVKLNPFTGKLDVVDSPSGDFSTVELNQGTQTSPSIAFDGDPNTGIYSPGADQLALSTSGVGRVFVDANGNVGLNTNTPDVFGRFYTRNIGLSSSGSTALQINAAAGSNAVIDVGVNSVRTAGFTSNTAEPIITT